MRPVLAVSPALARRCRLTALLGAVAAAALAGCSGDDDGGHADDGTAAHDAAASDPDAAPAGEFAAFDQAVLDFLGDHGLTGASAVVIDRDEGQIYLQGYGDFAADRRYLIASSSKILSVGVLLRLADQGLVDFDAPIGTYLAKPFGDGGSKADLTLAQLFSNSSGLISLTENPLYRAYRCQFQSTGTLTDCARQIYLADDADDLRPPDTEFHYGGAPWQLAGGVAEVASGNSWDELVAETYAPCGASSLGYANQFDGSGLGYPEEFDGDPANLPATDNPSVEGGGYVNALDYGKLLLMHLRGGACGDVTVLSPGAVERMREDRILAVYGGNTGAYDLLEGYGMGWWIDRQHPGVFMDPGAYGAIPWLDLPRGYGAFIAIEGGSMMGVELAERAKPVLDAILDAR